MRQSIDRQQRSWISNQEVRAIAPRIRSAAESPIILCLQSDELTLTPYPPPSPPPSDLIVNDSVIGRTETAREEEGDDEEEMKNKSDD